MTTKKTDQTFVGRVVIATCLSAWPRAFQENAATVARVIGVRATDDGWLLTIETGKGRVARITEETLMRASRLAHPDVTQVYPNREDTYLTSVRASGSNRHQVVVTGDGGETTEVNQEPEDYHLPERYAAWLGRSTKA